MSRHKHGLQCGFSLVELAVASALFSMGLGSLSIMLLTAVHGTAEARNQTMASVQASSLAEMIALSSDAYGHHIFPDGDIAATDFATWQNQLRDQLPGGEGLVCRDSTPDDGNSADPSCDGHGVMVVKIFWTEPSHENSGEVGQQRVVSRLAW